MEINDSGKSVTVDLLVIGGGITGVGIAQDASSRGLKTALVEKNDFASGTSSKSSKQIHGGLRYLEHFSLGLMYESISERHTLTRLAPGLVRWAPFLLPHFASKGKKWRASVGLWLYDHLAWTGSELRHRRLTFNEILNYSPQLRKEGLIGGALFYDCVTDDARLVLSIALDARSRGCLIYNYVAAEELIIKNRRAVGAVVRDVLTGESWQISARQVVCAAGPWTDQTLSKLGEARKEKRIRPAKGVHIVLRRERLDVHHVVLIPSAHDRRFLFVIPWYEGIVVGTTDTEFLENPDDVRPERDDLQYILDAINWSFPDAGVGNADIVSSYAGIRPLVNAPGKSTADVPREYKLFESPSGIIVVAGGKLTTYRRMAKVVVDRVVRRLKSENQDLVAMPCWTQRIRLGFPPDPGFDPFAPIDLAEDIRKHLLADYGTWARQIVSILADSPQWSRRMVPGLPYILAEAYFGATQEMARTIEDILSRRTRVTLLNPDQGRSCAFEVSQIMAKVLKWSPEERQRQLKAYEKTIEKKFPGGTSLKN